MTGIGMQKQKRSTTKTRKFTVRNCNCGLAIRMNSTVAAKAIAALREYDNEVADKIIAETNATKHKDWCGSAAEFIKARP